MSSPIFLWRTSAVVPEAPPLDEKGELVLVADASLLRESGCTPAQIARYLARSLR